MIVDNNLPLAEYHASEYVSHSKLLCFVELGPYAYYQRHVAGMPRSVTDAMELGNAAELYIQNHEAFKALYVEAPVLEGKADETLLAEATALGVLDDDGKPYSKRHNATTVHTAVLRARGQSVVTRSDMMRIERMANAFTDNAVIADVVRGLHKQVTLRDDFAELDVLPGIQARPDWYGERETVDLKTVSRFADVDRHLIPGHATQAAFIDVVLGRRIVHHLAVVESEWPYRTQLVTIDDETMAVANGWVRKNLDRLCDHYASGVWPLCQPKRTTTLPRWLRDMEG